MSSKFLLGRIAVLICTVWSGLGVSASLAEAKEISPDKAGFVFYAPGLKDGVFETTLLNWGHVTSARWLKEYPIAVVAHYSLQAPRYEWSIGQRDIKKIISELTNGEATDFGHRLRYNANVGSISYRTFSVRNDSCVGFVKEYGQKLISGLYCNYYPLSEEDVKAVLDGLGIKGRGKMPNK